MRTMIHTAAIVGILATPMIAAADPAKPGLKVSTALNASGGRFGSAVTDDAGNKSALLLQKQDQASIVGKDIPGASMPLMIVGDHQAADYTGGKTWGRVLRLAIGTANWDTFYDLGIDKAGNLFINSKNSTATQHVLTITPAGDVIIQGNLTVNGKINR